MQDYNQHGAVSISALRRRLKVFVFMCWPPLFVYAVFCEADPSYIAFHGFIVTHYSEVLSNVSVQCYSDVWCAYCQCSVH